MDRDLENQFQNSISLSMNWSTKQKTVEIICLHKYSMVENTLYPGPLTCHKFIKRVSVSDLSLTKKPRNINSNIQTMCSLFAFLFSRTRNLYSNIFFMNNLVIQWWTQKKVIIYFISANWSHQKNIDKKKSNK